MKANDCVSKATLPFEAVALFDDDVILLEDAATIWGSGSGCGCGCGCGCDCDKGED